MNLDKGGEIYMYVEPTVDILRREINEYIEKYDKVVQDNRSLVYDNKELVGMNADLRQKLQDTVDQKNTVVWLKRRVTELERIVDKLGTNTENKMGTKVGDICCLCGNATLVQYGGCATCPNCGAQLKCGL